MLGSCSLRRASRSPVGAGMRWGRGRARGRGRRCGARLPVGERGGGAGRRVCGRRVIRGRGEGGVRMPGCRWRWLGGGGARGGAGGAPLWTLFRWIVRIFSVEKFFSQMVHLNWRSFGFGTARPPSRSASPRSARPLRRARRKRRTVVCLRSCASQRPAGFACSLAGLGRRRFRCQSVVLARRPGRDRGRDHGRGHDHVHDLARGRAHGRQRTRTASRRRRLENACGRRTRRRAAGRRLVGRVDAPLAGPTCRATCGALAPYDVK